MQNQIKIAILNKKTITFFICLFLSFFSWTLIKLSKNTKEEIQVEIQVVNLPEDYFLKSKHQNFITLSVNGNGYAYLNYFFRKRKIAVLYSNLEALDSKRYQLSKNISHQIKSDFLSNFTILNTTSDVIYLDLEKIFSKKVPVLPTLKADFQKEYQLSQLTATPDSVVISGHKPEIDTLQNLPINIKKPNVLLSQSFTQTYPLNSTNTIRYTPNTIEIKAEINKINERILRIPIQTVNVPENLQIKLFPTEIELVCSGSLEHLKTLTKNDISVIADYKNIKKNTHQVPLHLKTELKNVKIRFLNKNEVDYLIKKI